MTTFFCDFMMCFFPNKNEPAAAGYFFNIYSLSQTRITSTMFWPFLKSLRGYNEKQNLRFRLSKKDGPPQDCVSKLIHCVPHPWEPLRPRWLWLSTP